MPSTVAIPPAARAAWIAIVGQDHVADDVRSTGAAATATFATRARVPLIVRPETRAQVQECVRVANEHGVPLYPVSSGLNWGYGSRVPASDGNVILDLGRMCRILDFSEPLAYVTVEPGVTQQQLFDYLRERGSGLWMDATGASPAASLIGNTMERGFGHTPYGDHFAHVCALEVVLGDGTCIETGFARFGSTVTAPVYRWGIGPVLDGLFTQSNLGIVTRMTIWLMPAPEYFEAFFFRCDDEADLARVMDALRPLKLSGTLRSAIHVGNDYKVLNGLQQYPWQETQGRTPLSPADMAPFRSRLRIGRWNGSGGLYGTPVQVAEARRLLLQVVLPQHDCVRHGDHGAFRRCVDGVRPAALGSLAAAPPRSVRNASESTRPWAPDGGSTSRTAASVGARSCNATWSRYVPGTIPGPIRIKGICASYPYGVPCVAVVSPAIQCGSSSTCRSPERSRWYPRVIRSEIASLGTAPARIASRVYTRATCGTANAASAATRRTSARSRPLRSISASSR